MNPMMEEGYWGMDEYSYEMEAISRGRFGRNLRHEHSKQARHEIKGAEAAGARRSAERAHRGCTRSRRAKRPDGGRVYASAAPRAPRRRPRAVRL